MLCNAVEVAYAKEAKYYKMAELEAVTRFSLRSVLMARMVILGGMGLTVLAVCEVSEG